MKTCFAFLLFSCNLMLYSQSPTDLPLFAIQDLSYVGAFRISSAEYGISDMNYSQGPIEYNPENHSIFIVGHTYQQAIAEFPIPEVIDSDVITELNMSDLPIQEFTSVIDKAPTGNPQNMNRIGGLKYMNGSLLVNCYEYYDADGNATHSTLKIADASSIATSAFEGFFSFQGGAGQTSGWISTLPSDWATYLEADYITGQSSGIPIISRTSVGPSAYTFKEDSIRTTGTTPTEQYLDFSFPNGIHDDLDNSDGENDVWTHLSQVVYGFVVPGTRTYLTIGVSGGHEYGVCYKCEQDNGNVCGGYCTPVVSDNYQYFWLWDMRDLMDVNNGLMQPYEARPYDYGKFHTPFQSGFKRIGGGSYDIESNKLYLTVQRADTHQGTYANPPVIAIFEPLNSTVLPVEWQYFTAEEYNNKVLLRWVVENNESTDYYVIERKLKREWREIGSTKEKEFIDLKPAAGKISYRIKQVDFNGSYSYSPTRVLYYQRNIENVIFPNPVTDFLSLKKEPNSFVYIYNLAGQKLTETKDSSFSVSHLSAGIYLAKVDNKFYRFIKD